MIWRYKELKHQQPSKSWPASTEQAGLIGTRAILGQKK